MALVSRVSSLTGSGVKDWILQRLSAVVLAVFVFFLVGYFISNPHPNFAQWQALFSYWWMKWFTLLVAIMIVFHAWVGIWTVLTDYIHCVLIRSGLQLLFVLAYVLYIFWSVKILWG